MSDELNTRRRPTDLPHLRPFLSLLIILRSSLFVTLALCVCAGVPAAWGMAPETSIESLERDLTHGQFAVRSRAARILGYIGNSAHGKTLAEMALRDRAREPRHVAAYALGQIGDPSRAPVLRARLLNELTSASAASGKSAAKNLQDAVVPLIRTLAVLDVDAAADALVLCLSRPDPTIQREAILALGRSRDASALPVLLTAARTGLVENRLAAAQALAWRASPHTVPGLTNLLANTRDRPDDAEALTVALARQATGDATAGLISTLQHPLPEARRRAAEMLGRLGVPAAADALERACQDNVIQVRSAALLSLAHVTPADAAPIAHAALDSSAPAEREAAVRALGVIPDDSATTKLTEIARGSDDGLAAVATQALAEREIISTSAVIIELARTGGTRTRRAAIEALAWRGDHGAASVFLDALAAPSGASEDDESALPTWKLAAEGLALNGVQDVVPQLLEMLDSPDKTVQARAVETLGMIGGQAAVSALCKVDRMGLPREVRRARIEALAPHRNSGATGALVAALSDLDKAVCGLAATALIWQGPEQSMLLLDIAAKSPPRTGLPQAVNEAIGHALAHRWFAGSDWDGKPREALAEWARGPGAECEPDRFRPYAEVLRAMAGEEDALSDLGELLLGPETEPELRDLTCRVIGESEFAPSAPLVREYLKTLYTDKKIAPAWTRGPRRPHLVIRAIRAAGDLRDRAAIPLLYNGLGDSASVRAASIEALAQIDLMGVHEIIRRGCRDESATVRGTAIRLLCRDLRQDDFPLLVEGLGDSTPEERTTIARAMSRRQEKAAPGLLRRLLADDDLTVALAAVSSLAMSMSDNERTQEAVQFLDRALHWTANVSRDDAALRTALSRTCGKQAELHSYLNALPQAVRWHRRAYLMAPTPDALSDIAFCWLKLQNEAVSHSLARRAAWEWYQKPTVEN